MKRKQNKQARVYKEVFLFSSLFKDGASKPSRSKNFFTVLFFTTLKGDILQLHIEWRFLVLAKKVPVKKAPAKQDESSSEESSSDEEEVKAAPAIKGEKLESFSNLVNVYLVSEE